MARLPKRVLFEKVEDAARASGWNVLLLSRANEHPARFRVFRDDERLTLRVYIWNVSHGGGEARPAHEYRIQITGIERFQPEPDGRTLILGWYDDLGVFAAFDFRHHRGRLGASPSMQISENALEEAARNGLAPYNRGNGELAIAVRPDAFGVYIQNLDALHATGTVPAELDVLSRAASDPDEVEPDEVDETVAEPRRRALQTTLRLLRDIRFRGKVLGAYRHRCSFCGVQLNLLDAAHILPVGHPESTDQVTNGISLCALHHRAYDRSLVTFDRHYEIILNEVAVAEMRAEHLAGGLQDFRDALMPEMILPAAAAQQPSKTLLAKANRFRGWDI
jgi:putative restriction endonuclease